MHPVDKNKLKPRPDLKGRIHAAGHLTIGAFAKARRINVRTLYSVLGGARANGPEAKRITRLILALPPKHEIC